MELKKELPRTGDINKCCGKPTVVGKIRVDIRMMSEPPRTADRWLHVFHWQCMSREDHNGDYFETSDQPKLEHANVFDSVVDEDIGDEVER